MTAIEGLSWGGRLHPLQQAFIDHDGLQRGYSTPGQSCSAVAMATELAPSRKMQHLYEHQQGWLAT